jgi:hypothetical protein
VNGQSSEAPFVTAGSYRRQEHKRAFVTRVYGIKVEIVTGTMSYQNHGLVGLSLTNTVPEMWRETLGSLFGGLVKSVTGSDLSRFHRL